MFKGLMLAAGAAMVAALFLAGTASAQYPQPKGSLVCVTRGGGSEIHATLRDSKGSPIKGQIITFTIISGHGSLDAYKTATDANGYAWVRATGNVTVAASYDGLRCSSVAQVLGKTFYPPSTGDAGLAAVSTGSSSDRLTSPFVAICLALLGATGTGVLVLRRHRLAVESAR